IPFPLLSGPSRVSNTVRQAADSGESSPNKELTWNRTISQATTRTVRTTSADSRAGAARVARAPSSRADPVATRADPVASNRVARSRAASAAMTAARAAPVREVAAVARESPAAARKAAAAKTNPARADPAVSRVAPASTAVRVVARADSTSSADRLTHHR